MADNNQEEQEPQKSKVDRFIFIYDADSGKMGAFLDSARKLLMVGGCALCTITYGILGEKTEWKDCKEELGIPIDYYHRDDVPEFLREQVTGHLPCILARVGTRYVMLLEPAVLKRCRGDVRDLKGRIQYYLAANNLTL
jgi:hypothetical protein